MELPFPFSHSKTDLDDGVDVAVLVAQIETGENRTVRRFRGGGAGTRTLVGDDRMDDVAGPVVVTDTG